MRRTLTMMPIPAAMLAFMAMPASAGTGWVVQNTPSPGIGSLDELIAVSCASVSNCVAVGNEGTSAGSTALAEGWKGGSTWTLQTAANPPGDTSVLLSGVSCPSTTFCVAVGSNSSGSSATAIAESWNGSTWALQSPVSPAAAVLDAVSCTAVNNCEAVGRAGRSGLAEHWNGSTWTAQSLPATVTQLVGVSCVSATDCEAVGSGAANWNGSTWTAQTLVSPFVPQAVSCGSASSCEAAGLDGSLATTEHWNGSTWTAQTAVSNSALLGVSCASATSCIAVGQTVTGTSPPTPLAESWNGSTWTVQSVPKPSGAGAALFQAVSCPATTECIGVGDWYVSSPSLAMTLAEQWTG